MRDVQICEVGPRDGLQLLRQVMPDIEVKLAAGVQLGVIHKALVTAGFELSFQTLKTYLYRHRRKEASLIRVNNAFRQPAEISQSTECSVVRDSDENSSNRSATREPLSMQEIDRLMRPDPAQQAEKLARYERLAKQERRSRE